MEFHEKAKMIMDIAESKVIEKDYIAAKYFANNAQSIYPQLAGLDQLLTIIDVYISGEKMICGEPDWYGILGVEPLADDETIKKQFKKLARLLHPDKNKCKGAEGATKLVLQAWKLLSDETPRIAYNARRRVHETQTLFSARRREVPSYQPGVPFVRENVVRAQTQHDVRVGTFWTECEKCEAQFEFERTYQDKNLRCLICHEPYIAREVPLPPSDVKPENLSSNQQFQNFKTQASTNENPRDATYQQTQNRLKRRFGEIQERDDSNMYDPFPGNSSSQIGARRFNTRSNPRDGRCNPRDGPLIKKQILDPNSETPNIIGSSNYMGNSFAGESSNQIGARRFNTTPSYLRDGRWMQKQTLDPSRKENFKAPNIICSGNLMGNSFGGESSNQIGARRFNTPCNPRDRRWIEKQTLDPSVKENIKASNIIGSRNHMVSQFAGEPSNQIGARRINTPCNPSDERQWINEKIQDLSLKENFEPLNIIGSRNHMGDPFVGKSSNQIVINRFNTGCNPIYGQWVKNEENTEPPNIRGSSNRRVQMLPPFEIERMNKAHQDFLQGVMKNVEDIKHEGGRQEKTNEEDEVITVIKNKK